MLHPLIVVTGLWGPLLGLYSLHLSDLLLYPVFKLVPIALAIWVPFAIVALGYALWRPRILRKGYQLNVPSRTQLAVIEKRLRLLFRFWIGAAIFETIASGGVPIVWLFTNPQKTYVDYGVPSLHGFVNSLLLALALSRVSLYLLSGERRHLRVPLLSIFWWIALVTRGTIFYSLAESTILWFCIRPVNFKTIAKIAAYGVIVVLFFGWVGDLRTGAENFRALARPSANYPLWLPSGVLWVYIYATTPINNLEYTRSSREPENNLLLPHTLSLLLPTVVRNIVYEPGELSGALVDPVASNVSTAYLGPLQDFGLTAVFLFSMVTALLCQWFWYKSDPRSLLTFAVLAQCLVFSIFFDLFLSLPIIAQVGWFYLIFRKTGQNATVRLAKRDGISYAATRAL
jgi:oligosaccharide repeat unit polymerase